MPQSNAEKLANMDPLQRQHFFAQLDEDEATSLMSSWRGFHARPHQIAPDGDWDIWMILSGRGWGKTRSGAEWVREQVFDKGCRRIALIGETQKDLEEVMIEGASGLLSVCLPGEIIKYTKKPVQVSFSNGAIGLGYNATQPDQLRGPNFDAAWGDEIAKWRYSRQTWDQLQFGLRLGDNPQVLVTTTPRPIELVLAINNGEEGKVVVTRGSTYDNASNLAPKFLRRVTDRYSGTRLGRQELEGQILGDIPNALWTSASIENYRAKEPPTPLGRIVVAIDPAISDIEGKSNEHGIMVVGLSQDGKDAYVLEDGSLTGSPEQWARHAITLFDKWQADCIVCEINQGGDMVSHTIRTIRSVIPINPVRASRGKHIRAEPISSLYEQGRVHHVGMFNELETQMSQMTSAGYEGSGSPDRLDALVWACTDLFPQMVRERTSNIPVLHIPINYPMARRNTGHA